MLNLIKKPIAILGVIVLLALSANTISTPAANAAAAAVPFQATYSGTGTPSACFMTNTCGPR